MSNQIRSGSEPAADSAALDRTTSSRAVAWWLRGLTLLVIGSWVLLGLQMLKRNDAAPNSTADNSPTSSGHASNAKAPWGRLKFLPIAISPPPEFAPERAPPTSEPVQWHFPSATSAQLAALFSEAELSESLRQKLVALAEPDPGIEGLTIRPTREIILGLSREDRSALYTLLSEYPENLPQAQAFRFCGGSLDEWIGDSPLAPQSRKLIEPLVYRHGSVLFFADLHAVEGLLPSPEERSLLVEALSHESTFLVRIDLSGESNLEALIEYWGRGRRARVVRPILEALHNSDGEQSIDITHLLPPLARRRLYTYDAPTTEEPQSHRDCHWAALNFFAEVPDDRFCDFNEVTRALKEDYYCVYGNLRLGDLVTFSNDKMVVFQTAVFIADDVFFTRMSGRSPQPWLLMKFEHMRDCFPRRNGLQIRYYRRDDL